MKRKIKEYKIMKVKDKEYKCANCDYGKLPETKCIVDCDLKYGYIYKCIRKTRRVGK